MQYTALLYIYFENKNEYKAEKILYTKSKHAHINLRITQICNFELDTKRS